MAAVLLPQSPFQPSTVRAREIWMSVPVVNRSPEQSFEELRIEDYTEAYYTTGGPPTPCPPEPTGENDRVLLNLPPLFQPYSDSPPLLHPTQADTGNAATPLAAGNPLLSMKAENLPATQIFHPVDVRGEIFQSISCMSEYTEFCHEELRYYAYKNDNALPPIPVRRQDVLLSISAKPDYIQHSVEELRVAYLQLGRELTSAEIFKFGSHPTALKTISLSRSLLFTHPVGGGFSRSPATPSL